MPSHGRGRGIEALIAHPKNPRSHGLGFFRSPGECDKTVAICVSFRYCGGMARAHIDRTDTSDHLDPLYRAYKAGLVNGVGHAWTPNEADDDEKVWPEFIAWKVDQ